MKIGFYSVATHLGGAERSLLDIVTRLHQQSNGRYHPWVIVPQATGPLVEKLKEHNIGYETLPFPKNFLKISKQNLMTDTLKALPSSLSLAGYGYKLATLFKQADLALIHTSGIKCHLLAGTTVFLHNKKVLCHLRDVLPRGKALNSIKALGKLHNCYFVANSKATAATLSPHPVTTVYNGIDEKLYLPQKNNYFRQKLGLADNTPLVGVVAVLAKWKGQLEFIEMAKTLITKGSAAHFIIVGDTIYDTTSDSSYKNKLIKTIADCNLNDRIHMVGFESDPVQVMQSLDVVVHTSIQPEAFGRVIIEAMACEKPVVASDAGGPAEIIEDKINGLLYPPGCVDAMTEAVNKLLSEAQFASSLASVGRSHFLQNFTVTKMVQEIIACYDKILI